MLTLDRVVIVAVAILWSNDGAAIDPPADRGNVHDKRHDQASSDQTPSQHPETTRLPTKLVRNRRNGEERGASAQPEQDRAVNEGGAPFACGERGRGEEEADGERAEDVAGEGAVDVGDGERRVVRDQRGDDDGELWHPASAHSSTRRATQGASPLPTRLQLLASRSAWVGSSSVARQ